MCRSFFACRLPQQDRGLFNWHLQAISYSLASPTRPNKDPWPRLPKGRLGPPTRKALRLHDLSSRAVPADAGSRHTRVRGRPGFTGGRRRACLDELEPLHLSLQSHAAAGSRHPVRVHRRRFARRSSDRRPHVRRCRRARRFSCLRTRRPALRQITAWLRMIRVPGGLTLAADTATLHAQISPKARTKLAPITFSATRSE